MAQLNHNNPFQSWVLTPQEEIQGSILNLTQKQVIQNRISELMQEKTLLKFTPDNAHSFIQREAELQGQIGILQYLIANSEDAERKLLAPIPSDN